MLIKRYIISFLALSLSWCLLPGNRTGNLAAQAIDSAEYFFDTDPGIGNGFVYSVNKGDTISDSISISTAGLTMGFHTMYYRLRDTTGTWSLYEGWTIYLQDSNVTASAGFDSIASEIFFNTDSGTGTGIAQMLTPGDTIIDTVWIAPSGLTTGFHQMYSRLVDSNQVWSLYDGNSFYIQDSLSSLLDSAIDLNYAEYFFDADPGIGLGTPLNSFSAIDSLVLNDTLATTGLLAGDHQLFVRVRDTNRVWSLYEGKTFTICNMIPLADFNADTACALSPTLFTDLSSNLDTNFAYTYAWDFNNDGVADDTTKGSVSTVYTNPGTHTVTLIVDNTNGCTDTVTKVIYVDSLPTVNLLLTIDTICKDDTITLAGGNPPGGIFSGNGVLGTSFYGDSVSAGWNTITYTYYTADSCMGSASDIIYVGQCLGISDVDQGSFNVSIQPNPFHSTTLVSLHAGTKAFMNMHYKMFNVVGKEVRAGSAKAKKFLIERGSLPAGIYLLRLYSEEKVLGTAKLVAID